MLGPDPRDGLAPQAGGSRLLVLLSRWRIDVAWLALASIPFAHPTCASVLGWLPLSVAALALRVWARGHLERDIYLTQTGPYAFVRHPLYIGSFFLGLSFALMTRVPPIVLLFPPLFVALYLPKALREEMFLQHAYAEAYAGYVARVPALLPTFRRTASSRFAREMQRFAWRRVLRNHEWQTWLGVVAVLLLLWARAGGFTPVLARSSGLPRSWGTAPFAPNVRVGDTLLAGQ